MCHKVGLPDAQAYLRHPHAPQEVGFCAVSPCPMGQVASLPGPEQLTTVETEDQL